MVKLSTWRRYYSQWKTDCREDLRRRGHGVTRTDPEIYEDGAIRWNGMFHCSDAGYVTPWRKSKWYRE